MTATITLHHGNCVDVLAGLPDASVDAVVTDPPYGLRLAKTGTRSHGAIEDNRRRVVSGA